MYGSIFESPLERETIVGLQDKLLHLMAVMQSADAAPTQSTLSSVEKLIFRKDEMIARWKLLNNKK